MSFRYTWTWKGYVLARYLNQTKIFLLRMTKSSPINCNSFTWKLTIVKRAKITMKKKEKKSRFFCVHQWNWSSIFIFSFCACSLCIVYYLDTNQLNQNWWLPFPFCIRNHCCQCFGWSSNFWMKRIRKREEKRREEKGKKPVIWYLSLFFLLFDQISFDMFVCCQFLFSLGLLIRESQSKQCQFSIHWHRQFFCSSRSVSSP